MGIKNCKWTKEKISLADNSRASSVWLLFTSILWLFLSRKREVIMSLKVLEALNTDGWFLY